jgi:hypothetical protein
MAQIRFLQSRPWTAIADQQACHLSDVDHDGDISMGTFEVATKLESSAGSETRGGRGIKKRAAFLATVLVFGCAAFLSPLTSRPSAAQEETSFRSWNFPDRYIRHRNLLAYIDPIAAEDKLGRKDSTFRIVPGLAGKCRSFESVNYPGYFLRHQDFRLKLAKQTDDQLFKDDATFCVVWGLASEDGRSFESVNFPKHYIRHSNFELWLAKFENTTLFRKDATFIISPPLTSHRPSQPIDP